MPKICYTPKEFNPERTNIITKANSIIAQFAQAGYDLTLRQLYYQFVRRNWFPNTWADPKTGSTNNERSYKKLGSIINDARLAGLVDWSSIEDRTRNLQLLPHWETIEEIIDSISKQYRCDLWVDQPIYCEVWVEKDALLGVIARVANRFDVPYFSCRGYTSQSEMWGAAQRLIEHAENGQATRIIHLGDHDPSGKDMSRDITDRIKLFMEYHDVVPVDVDRIALNMDQIDEFKPPPNPAKVTDSRASGYIAEFGNESWELDALEPDVLDNLISNAIESCIEEPNKFEARRALVAQGRELLKKTSKRWAEVVKLVSKEKKGGKE